MTKRLLRDVADALRNASAYLYLLRKGWRKRNGTWRMPAGRVGCAACRRPVRPGNAYLVSGDYYCIRRGCISELVRYP